MNGEPIKKIILSIIILAGIGTLFYAHHEQVTKSTPIPLPDISTQTGQEVKGVSQNAPNVPKISYDESQAINHYSLTVTNIIWYTNYYRVQNGLKPLSESKTLDASAHNKGLDMLAYQYFEHTRPNSSVGFDSFIKDQNYQYAKIGENLAMGDFTTSKEVVDAWMASPPHKKNILDVVYQNIGISINIGSMNGQQTVLITQHFGEPIQNCPAIDTTLKSTIATLNDQALALQKTIDSKQTAVTNNSNPTDPDYNNLIDTYNTLVSSYNGTVRQIENLVATYNQEVNNFDNCIKAN